MTTSILIIIFVLISILAIAGICNCMHYIRLNKSLMTLETMVKAYSARLTIVETENIFLKSEIEDIMDAPENIINKKNKEK
jgi:cell division protein FtsB